LERYIQNARREGFDVRVATIEIDYEDNSHDISRVREICERLEVPRLTLNITRDYVEEARRIRRNFYPH
jgi:hypothetical protein